MIQPRLLAINKFLVRARHAAALLLLLCTLPAQAADPVLRRLFVSGGSGGVLEMRVPPDWARVGLSTPIDLRFARPGSADVLRLTAFPVQRERLAALTDAKLQESLHEAGKKVIQGSVEQRIEIKPLVMASGRGYYFSVTDRALEGKPNKAGSFRYLHSGVLLLGNWFGAFNIYSNQKDGAFVKEALAAVQSLRWDDPAQVERGAAKGIDRARLAGAAPKEWQATNELLCNSPQAKGLYDRFNDLYAPMLGTRTVKSSHESFDAGNGDAGSVLYMEFNTPVQADLKAFVGGLLWGDQLPKATHAEEYFAAGKHLVIWCTRADSAIRKLSQARLESALFGK